MCALADESGNITNDMDETVKVAERFYADLYSTNARPENSVKRTRLFREASTVTKDEVEKALKEMKGKLLATTK